VTLQELQMVSNLPHVAVRLQPSSAEGTEREALLMVDLGASGSEIIFHSRAVQVAASYPLCPAIRCPT
jgi:hypothetical protein